MKRVGTINLNDGGMVGSSEIKDASRRISLGHIGAEETK